MVLAEDIIFAVRDLLNNDKGNLNFHRQRTTRCRS